MKLPKNFPEQVNLAGYLLLQQGEDELFNWVLLNQAANEQNGRGMRVIEAKERGLVRREIGKLLDPAMRAYRMEEEQLQEAIREFKREKVFSLVAIHVMRTLSAEISAWDQVLPALSWLHARDQGFSQNSSDQY